MHKCPKCGHEWRDSKRSKGGKARWHGMTKEQRSEAARKAAKARWHNAIKAAANTLEGFDGLPTISKELRRGLGKDGK